MSGAVPREPGLEDERADALDKLANTLTSAVLRLELALVQLAAADLSPRTKAAAALLAGLPERLVELGPELTRLSD